VLCFHAGTGISLPVCSIREKRNLHQVSDDKREKTHAYISLFFPDV
jgi:hypothetical protein